jgi:DNA-binding FadR family transcriptional regulator
VQIVGVRLGAPVARLLSELLDSRGYPETAAKIADAIERQWTLEAPLTLADHEAIIEALAEKLPDDAPPAAHRASRGAAPDRRITGG